MQLSTRVQQLVPSTTLAITSRARKLKSAGYDVIDLGVGEPDFNTPNYIVEAAKVAMDEGKTRYTPSAGIPELKEAIINKFQRENNLSYSDKQITVTVGAKQALYNAFQVIINPGDEVIIPAPYWVSYVEQVKLAGGKPIIIECSEENSFKLTPDHLKSAITRKTKALLLNSPSNPTGMIYTLEELQELGSVCKRYEFYIISDEIYEHLIYQNESHISIASLDEDLYNRTIIINGVSKAYAMTGWRIGYAAAGDSDVIKAMTDLSSHSTSNPTSISQHAAVAALNGPSEMINEMKDSFKVRLNYVLERIHKIPELECKKPLGAFYVYINIQKALEAKNMNCDQWVEALLENEQVAVIPGTAFGSAQYVRISYATSMEQLKKAFDRINRFTASHEQAQ